MHGGPCSNARRLLDICFDLRGQARCNELCAVGHRSCGPPLSLTMHIGPCGSRGATSARDSRRVVHHLRSFATTLLDDRTAHLGHCRRYRARPGCSWSLRCRRAVAIASRGGDEHVHDCRGARQALAIYVTLCLIRTEARPHNFDRSPVTALAACLYANGRALIAGTLQAASTSAIMSDRSSWLRLPPLMPPAAASMCGARTLGRSGPNY